MLSRQIKSISILYLMLTLLAARAQAPMPIPGQTGWMNEDQRYYKLTVTEDGIYKITFQDLINNGIPAASIYGKDLVLYTNGQAINIHVTTDSLLGSADYLLFFGEKNRGDVDQLIYADAAQEQLNPRFSLYSNARSYYLSWTDKTTHPRFEIKDNGLNNLGTVPLKEDYYIHHETIEYHDFHVKPTHNGRDFIRFSNMDVTEGFGSAPSNDREITIPVSHLSNFGVDPAIELRFGTNVVSRNWQVSVNDWVVANVSKSSYDIAQVQQLIPADLIRNGDVRIRIKALSDRREKHSLAYATLKYPRRYDFGNQSNVIFHQQGSIIARLIEVKNFSGTRPVLFNLTEGWMMTPETVLNTLRYTTPASFKTWKWIATDMIRGVKSISSLTPVSKPKLAAGNYWIITGGKLAGTPAVNDYANYRSSAAGGGYQVSVVNVDQLYDDYAYGIQGHPIAIKNYIRAAQHARTTPDYIFIIGKGREYAEQRMHSATPSIVPAFGIPGSDQLLISTTLEQQHQIAVGRLSANNTKDVQAYLDKIILHENANGLTQSLEDLAWRKRILHLSGGSADIQNLIYGYLSQMGDIISNNKFGGDITTYRKTSSDPIQKNQTDEIIKSINSGVALLSFFGHSAVGTFDFSLENPAKYNNKGKNPVILSLGCHSGNIYTPSPGISEEFVLQPESGAIAFIASSGTAYIAPQYDLGRRIYGLLGNENYGLTIGEVLRSALVEAAATPDISVKTLRQQITLHGDPAYRLVDFEGPDFIIDDESVSVQPEVIDQTTDSLFLTFDVVNLGASLDQDLVVRVVHRLGDGSSLDTILIEIPAPYARQRIDIKIPKADVEMSGLNILNITVDPANEIAESPDAAAEQNNELIMSDGTAGYEFYVFDNGAKPVYPADFGIVSDASVSLQASISNSLAPGGAFVFQLDTTNEFNSPFLLTQEVYGTSSNVAWTPEISWSEGQVYYWRIAPLSAGDLKSNQWQERSFIYLNGSSHGWNQSHYYQWKKDAFFKMKLDDTRRFDFEERIWEIRIKNELREIQDFWVFVNNTAWASLNPKALAPGIAIFIWHPESLIFNNNGTDYGSLRYSRDGFVYHLNRRADRANIKRLLDAAPDGARIFIHTILADEDSNLHTSEWAADKAVLGYDLFEVFESYGAKKVRGLQLRGTVPYTFIFDKGIGPVVEDIANNIYETIDLSSKARGKWEDGQLTSTLIPTGRKMSYLEWSEDKVAADSTWLEIRGIRGTTYDVLKTVSNQYRIDLSDINTATYPFIQLIFHAKDIQNKSSAQLNYWRVYHTPIADAAIIMNEGDRAFADTLDAGVPMAISYTLKNLGDAPMEPILVRYHLVSTSGKNRTLLKRTQALPANGEIIVQHEISTDDLKGLYTVNIEVNVAKDQLELTDCNNRGSDKIYIIPDSRNPILEVTFDGRRIENGTKFQNSPIIHVTLRDPNSRALLNNPEDFDIKLFYPAGLRWAVSTGSKAARFEPATSIDDNKARFVLTPNLTLLGTYTLAVQAKDIAGNRAGDISFQVSFEMVDGGDEVLFSVFPNPATDYVDFEYYLPDDRDPTIFALSIYTVDGKHIHTAYRSDFGGLEKGVNRYRWNLVDKQGNALPTGIYTFQLINDIDTLDLQKRGKIFVYRN